MITNITFIGINSTDNYLLASYYDKNDLKQEIINKNFTNNSIIEKNPDAIVALTRKYLDSYKLKNQYACFNLNYDPITNNNAILPYYSRESCESGTDPYNRPKSYGVYDTTCKKDEECPFFQINKNYENDYGKCVNGKCELPTNMINVGYHYYKTDSANLPLCYNCNTSEFEIDTVLDTCCEKQFDKSKYPFLKSPDYAFEGDSVSRLNYFHTKYCSFDEKTTKLTCSKIEL
jgi:hypothetical protein